MFISLPVPDRIGGHGLLKEHRLLSLAALIVADLNLNKLSNEMEKKESVRIKDETKPVEEKKPDQPEPPQQPAKRIAYLQNLILKPLRRGGGFINDF